MWIPFHSNHGEEFNESFQSSLAAAGGCWLDCGLSRYTTKNFINLSTLQFNCSEYFVPMKRLSQQQQLSSEGNIECVAVSHNWRNNKQYLARTGLESSPQLFSYTVHYGLCKMWQQCPYKTYMPRLLGATVKMLMAICGPQYCHPLDEDGGEENVHNGEHSSGMGIAV